SGAARARSGARPGSRGRSWRPAAPARRRGTPAPAAPPRSPRAAAAVAPARACPRPPHRARRTSSPSRRRRGRPATSCPGGGRAPRRAGGPRRTRPPPPARCPATARGRRRGSRSGRARRRTGRAAASPTPAAPSARTRRRAPSGSRALLELQHDDPGEVVEVHERRHLDLLALLAQVVVLHVGHPPDRDAVGVVRAQLAGVAAGDDGVAVLDERG